MNILKRKSGMTIVEAMIAISIFTIGIFGFTYLFARTWKINAFILEEGQASMGASRALELMVKDLRKIRQGDNGDYPIKSGQDFDLVVYIDDDRDGITERVHYYLENQNLMKGVTNPTTDVPPVYPSGDETITTVAHYITNTSSQPIFYYYNRDYPGDTVNNPLDTSNLVTGQVRLIRIHLWVNIKPLTAPDNVNFESFVDLRNLNENQ